MAPGDAETEGASVLLVDDDPAARESMSMALELEGFRVVSVEDGAAAAKACRARAFDCVILDMAGPGASGFEVCRTLRSLTEGSHVPILIQTSLNDVPSINRAYDAGATDFTWKAANPTVVAQRVKFLVRAKQTQDKLRESEARVSYLAHYDPLTGLPNRPRLMQVLEQHLSWAALRHRGVAVLMLDVDNFSRLNDTMGQSVGDALLKEIGSRLRSCMRDPARSAGRSDPDVATADINDWVARTGADEFSMALPGVSTVHAAEGIARRIQTMLQKPFSPASEELALTASIGISLYPGDAVDAASLLKNADAALHHAKRMGQSGIECFKISISRRAARHLSLEADLRKALERHEFKLVYQPRLALDDLRVEAVEALLRWSHPERGMVAPDEFIPLAEQSGLIVEIGDWVLREACLQARRWQDAQSVPWRVAVNVSGVQFRDGSLVSRVSSAIKAAKVDPQSIELEFTEGALIEYSNSVTKAVAALKAMGVTTALDDFGTGYSSMSYLRQFALDILKIDRSFVRDIGEKNGGNAPLVDAIIAMARSLGLATVAEGVETDAQWRYLRNRGADQVQGFLFCKPLPVADLEAWHVGWLHRHQPQTGSFA